MKDPTVSNPTPLHPKADPVALADVTALRDRILKGEIVEFAWAGLAPDESIVTSMGPTRNQHMRLAALSRLLHRCNVDMDDSAVRT